MNFGFFNELTDQYLQTDQGQGVFLAGVVLGYIAKCQVGSEKDIKNSPRFKQIQFGRMDMKGLRRQMARVPQLLAAYDGVKPSHLVSALAAETGKKILSGNGTDLGIEGNFAFTVGFMNANEYFWKIFRKEKEDEGDVI